AHARPARPRPAARARPISPATARRAPAGSACRGRDAPRGTAPTVPATACRKGLARSRDGDWPRRSKQICGLPVPVRDRREIRPERSPPAEVLPSFQMDRPGSPHMSEASTTTDHNAIRKWVEARGGRPSKVSNADDDGGILRIDFGEKEPNLEEVSWDEFFEIFDGRKLAFLHQDET